MAASTPNAATRLLSVNVNVGVLGHVDSGKTALVAALSEILSVAALDKDPQSQERGITLDLGVSCFMVSAPGVAHAMHPGAEAVQFTLIDCPGHASLIKTVLVGAQTMDMMILVVDAVKGIQPQTAECIVIGELLCSSMVVALNKVDLLPRDGRMRALKRVGRSVASALQLTRFANSAIIPVAAKFGGKTGVTEGIADIRAALLDSVPRVARDTDQPLLMMADHCFAVKGHGTVLAGTVLRGKLAVGDTVEISACGERRKVRSLHVFRVPTRSVRAGDRVGVCVPQLPADRLERTFVSAPSTIPTFASCVCRVDRCRFFAGPLKSRSRVAVTIGFQTRMAEVIFFGQADQEGTSREALLAHLFARVGKHAMQTQLFDACREYVLQAELYGALGRPQQRPFQHDADVAEDKHYGMEWALLLLSKPLTAPLGSVMISTKLDLDIAHAEPSCRVAFYGNVCTIFTHAGDHKVLRLYRTKQRFGEVDKLHSDGSAIVMGMFKRETNLDAFVNAPVVYQGGAQGKVCSRFGQGGKVRVSVLGPTPVAGDRVCLVLKKFMYGRQ